MSGKQVGISVVIPCYNVEKHIINCLDSLLNCKYDNLQIVLVDDRSTDDTELIIKKYIEDHPQTSIIYIINPQNLGAGETRNVGITLTNKEYITFVDADDVVNLNFFSEVNRAIQISNSDCIVFEAAVKKNKENSKFDMFYGGRYKDEQFIPPRDAIVYIKGCTCGKVYKASVIKVNEVKFGNLKRNEDLIFTKVALSYTNSVYYINKVLYYYVENDSSLMHNTNLLNKKNAHNAFRAISNRLIDRNFNEELHSIFLIEVIYSTTMTCLRKNDNPRKNFREVTKGYIYNDKYYSGYKWKYKFAILMFRLNMFWALSFIV